MPTNELYPDSYAKVIKIISNKEGLKVDVWSYAKLKKEKMGLHLAVGEGSDNKPYSFNMSIALLKRLH